MELNGPNRTLELIMFEVINTKNMEIRVKIPKRNFKAKTKDGILSKIRNNYRMSSYCFGSNRNVSYDGLKVGEDLVVYNLEKVRRNKVKQTPNHWTASVYRFNIESLKSLGVKEIKQGTRTFKIKFH